MMDCPRPRRISRELDLLPRTSPAAIRASAIGKQKKLPLTVYAQASQGSWKSINVWLDQAGTHVDARCDEVLSGTLLHAAAIEGHLAMTKALLKRKANPDVQCAAGGTALMGAASQGAPPGYRYRYRYRYTLYLPRPLRIARPCPLSPSGPEWQATRRWCKSSWRPEPTPR
jgi:hypothetical protein